MRLSSNTPLVLGSASPRRREILTNVRVPFVVVVGDVDETLAAEETPSAYLTRIVRAKIAAVRAKLPPELASRALAVLAADTSVIDGATILGKPENEAEALAMVTRLSGRTHEVHTRFSVASVGERSAVPGGVAEHGETVVTRVTFRPLSQDEARAYAASGEGMDKAGGYAVQGLAAGFVSRIEGSYSNVVGLPACEVVVALGRLGLL